MKRHRFILYTLAGLSILFSCLSNKPYPEAIGQAERCMATHPDSALIYLSSLDSLIQFEPEETRMYHGLLTIKAKDKLYITHTSDSLIKTIARFYEDYGDADKRMEAYHYLGSVYRDMDDAPQAVKAFQRAIDAGKGSKRYDILGRIYEQMGTLFAYQGVYDEAMIAYKKAYGYSLKLKNDESIAITLRDIGRIYDSVNKQDSATYYYSEAYKKAIVLENKYAQNEILSEVGCFFIRQNKLDLAKDILLKSLQVENSANVLSGLGRIYLNSCQEDSALYYFKKSITFDNMYVKEGAYRALSKIDASKGDYRSALAYAYKGQEQADSIKKRTRTEIISKIHSLYNYQHIEKENHELVRENEKKKIQLYQLTLVMILIVVIVLGNTYYVRRKKKSAKEQERKLHQLKEMQYANSLDSIKKNKQKVNDLEELLLQAESHKDSLRKQLIQSQKELLEISNHKIRASQNEKDLLELSFKKSDIYLYFHEASNNEKLKISEENWDELQITINTTYPNFTTQLYALCPQLSLLELRICYLIKTSLQVKDIARLVGRSTSAITASRIRLYKKIHGTDGTAEMMDKFIIDL